MTAAVTAGSAARARFRLEHPLVVQIVRFACTSGASTAANAAVFLLLRLWFDAVPANLVALVLSTALSTELNRRFTFGGAETHRWRTAVQNTGTVLFYAFYSSAVLLVVGTFVDSPSAVLEAVAVAVASMLGGTARFLIMRYWVFPQREPATPGSRAVGSTRCR